MLLAVSCIEYTVTCFNACIHKLQFLSCSLFVFVIMIITVAKYKGLYANRHHLGVCLLINKDFYVQLCGS